MKNASLFFKGVREEREAGASVSERESERESPCSLWIHSQCLALTLRPAAEVTRLIKTLCLRPCSFMSLSRLRTATWWWMEFVLALISWLRVLRSAFRQQPAVGPGGQPLVSGWPDLSSALMNEVAARPHCSALARAQASLSERADGSWKACCKRGEKPQP